VPTHPLPYPDSRKGSSWPCLLQQAVPPVVAGASLMPLHITLVAVRAEFQCACPYLHVTPCHTTHLVHENGAPLIFFRSRRWEVWNPPLPLNQPYGSWPELVVELPRGLTVTMRLWLELSRWPLPEGCTLSLCFLWCRLPPSTPPPSCLDAWALLEGVAGPRAMTSCTGTPWCVWGMGHGGCVRGVGDGNGKEKGLMSQGVCTVCAHQCVRADYIYHALIRGAAVVGVPARLALIDPC
jgi:hypothetical protein